MIRLRSALTGHVCPAMQVNTLDYDGMCEIIRWCGGRAVGPEDPEVVALPGYLRAAVFAIDIPAATGGYPAYVLDQDWVLEGKFGFFPLRSWLTGAYQLVTLPESETSA